MPRPPASREERSGRQETIFARNALFQQLLKLVNEDKDTGDTQHKQRVVQQHRHCRNTDSVGNECAQKSQRRQKRCDLQKYKQELARSVGIARIIRQRGPIHVAVAQTEECKQCKQ